MCRESRRRSTFGPGRLLATAGAVLLAALGGCAGTTQTRALDLIARDASTGEPLEGVRIVRQSGTAHAAGTSEVMTTDATGSVVVALPVSDSVWMMVRDGYEPVRVDLREHGAEAVAGGPNEVVTAWAEVMAAGTLDIPLSPITYRTIRVSVVDSITGAPVPHATVQSEMFSLLDPDGTAFGTASAVGTRTDAHGLAIIDLPSASRCVVTVEADGHAVNRVILDPESAEGVAMHTTVPVEAYRYEPTRVVVIDRGTGLPVEGATIRVGLLSPTTGALRHESIWTTDAEGMAIVMKPAAGLGTMVVEHDGRAQTDFRMIEIHATEFNAVAIGADDLD